VPRNPPPLRQFQNVRFTSAPAGRFAQILVILGLRQVICFTISPPEIGEETARLVVRDNNSAKGLRETLSSPSSSSVQVVE
jgi:hypothetical protein